MGPYAFCAHFVRCASLFYIRMHLCGRTKFSVHWQAAVAPWSCCALSDLPAGHPALLPCTACSAHPFSGGGITLMSLGGTSIACESGQSVWSSSFSEQRADSQLLPRTTPWRALCTCEGFRESAES